MAQTTLTRILEDIKTLELNELQEIDHALQTRIEAAGYSLEEWNAMQSLVGAGLLTQIKPRCQDSTPSVEPIPIQGVPLSETIMDERR